MLHLANSARAPDTEGHADYSEDVATYFERYLWDYVLLQMWGMGCLFLK